MPKVRVIQPEDLLAPIKETTTNKIGLDIDSDTLEITDEGKLKVTPILIGTRGVGATIDSGKDIRVGRINGRLPYKVNIYAIGGNHSPAIASLIIQRSWDGVLRAGVIDKITTGESTSFTGTITMEDSTSTALSDLFIKVDSSSVKENAVRFSIEQYDINYPFVLGVDDTIALPDSTTVISF